MSEYIYMALALIAGAVLGTIFFGGLWLTIRIAIGSKTPGIWFAGSFMLRIALTFIGFYFVSLGSWQRLLLCFTGFMIARMVIVNLTKSIKDITVNKMKEVPDEA